MTTAGAAGNNTIWQTWTTNSASTSTDATWQAWSIDTTTANATSATTITSNDGIWYSWNDGAIQSVGRIEVQPETEEQVLAREARQAERKAQRVAAAKEKEEAKARAEELMIAFLDEKQKEQLDRDNSFNVEGGDRIFRIRRGRQGNIDELDAQGNVIGRFCIHPSLRVPDQDTMLAQKFMLETNQEAFLETANHLRH